jgi:phosphoglycolate phosphatase
MNGMLGRRSLPSLSAERYAHIFDFPVKDYYQKAGWDFEREPFLKLSDEFIEEYERRKLECPLREGAIEILSRNTRRGIPQSIISAAKQSSVEEMVKWYQVENLFVTVRGLDNHHAFGKVDIGLQWVSELALPPDQIFMVGDTVHDHEVARAMGVDCVLIPSGHQDKERLEATSAPVIDSLDALDF